jgi:hypothetical protein
MHEPLGNLRQSSFRQLWQSPKAHEVRASIAAKKCWCTTEVFMWPSIAFQPAPLLRSMIGGRIWETPSEPKGYSAESFSGQPTGTPLVSADRLARGSANKPDPING